MECIQLPFLLPGLSQPIDGSILLSVGQPQVSCHFCSSGPEIGHAWWDPGQNERCQPMQRFWNVWPWRKLYNSSIKICLSHRIDMNLMLGSTCSSAIVLLKKYPWSANPKSSHTSQIALRHGGVHSSTCKRMKTNDLKMYFLRPHVLPSGAGPQFLWLPLTFREWEERFRLQCKILSEVFWICTVSVLILQLRPWEGDQGLQGCSSKVLEPPSSPMLPSFLFPPAMPSSQPLKSYLRHKKITTSNPFTEEDMKPETP